MHPNGRNGRFFVYEIFFRKTPTNPITPSTFVIFNVRELSEGLSIRYGLSEGLSIRRNLRTEIFLHK